MNSQSVLFNKECTHSLLKIKCTSTPFNVCKWKDCQICIMQGPGDLSSKVFLLTTSRTVASDNKVITE